jgi:ATP-dependent DNA ligase
MGGSGAADGRTWNDCETTATPTPTSLLLEGIVGKDKESPYVSGRETWHWLKIKNRRFERKEPVEFKTRRKKR